MGNTLFIVYTPYQMLSTISTIKTYKIFNADVLIMHPMVAKYSEALKKECGGEVYEYKYLFDDTPTGGWFKKHLIVFINLLRKKKYLNSHELFSKQYRSLFVPSDDTSCRVVYAFLKKKASVSLYLYDDGVGTYSGCIYEKKKLISKMLYKLVLGESEFYERIERIYCYRPELVKNNTRTVEIKSIVFQTQSFLYEKELKDVLKAYEGKRIIFLDQGPVSDTPDIKDAIRILVERFGIASIVIKRHPRITGLNIYENLDVTKDGIPFEVIASVMDFEKSVIISDSSTCGITSLLFFNRRPYVIMLNKISKNKADNLIELFNSVNRLFESEVIYCPETMMEFEKYCGDIATEVKPARKVIECY